jgi:hypothetical protein
LLVFHLALGLSMASVVVVQEIMAGQGAGHMVSELTQVPVLQGRATMVALLPGFLVVAAAVVPVLLVQTVRVKVARVVPVLHPLSRAQASHAAVVAAAVVL